MGSCVSLSRAPPPASTTAPELGRQVAKVVGLDGTMAKFEGPVTAREALLTSCGQHTRASPPPPPCFLCSSDELGFDAPAHALAADEQLRSGQLYFVLPASALRWPLSGKDMAALAVKAARALAVEAGLTATAGGVSSPSRHKGGGGGAAGNKLRKTARVVPDLVAMSNSKETNQSWEGAWKSMHLVYEYDSGRTVGKTRHHGVVRGGRGRAGVQRLSAIVEVSE